MSDMTHDGQPTANQPQQPNLESRINTRRAQLIKALANLKADTRVAAAEARDKIKSRLSELRHVVKWGVADGWASVGEPVTNKLEHWLAESAHQLPPAAASIETPTTTYSETE